MTNAGHGSPLIRHVLSSISYARQDVEIAALPDPKICGGPEIWHA